MPRKIEISHKTIFFTAVFVALLWFLYFIRDIILLFFIALLIMAILNPLVSRLSKLKIPRGVSVLLVYLVVIGLLVASIVSIFPPLVEETSRLAGGLPGYVDNINLPGEVTENVTSEILSIFKNLSSQLVKAGVSLVSNILTLITILIIAFYLLLARDRLGDQLENLFGNKRKRDLVRLVNKLEKRLGVWARGQLFLMLIVGLMTYVGLVIMGIPFALPLALLAGILEIVPYIGPMISAVPGVIVGFGISPTMGFLVTGLFFLIQQLENYLIVPKVMEKSAGVNPVITLLALAIGFRIAGLVGILISLPFVITVQVVAKEYMASK